MKRLVLLFLLSFSCAQASVYTVKKGENLWFIAKKFNLNHDYLALMNDLRGEKIFPGQKVIIPTRFIKHRVSEGDQLGILAKKFHTRIDLIIILNNLSDENLKIGQSLLIPIFDNHKKTLSANGLKRNEYLIQPGDNMSQLAKKWGVSVDDVKKWNHKKNDKIFVGEKLIYYSDNSVQKKEIPDYYIVKKGDNLSKIAIAFHLSQTDILSFNHIENDKIFIGEKLYLKKQKEVQKRTPNFVSYIVQSGDTLSAIAKENAVSIAQIKKWNHLKRENLYIGEKIKLLKIKAKVKKKLPTKWYYRVRSGDNLSTLSKRFAVKKEDIMKWNHKNTDTLLKGESLVIYGNKPVLHEKILVHAYDTGHFMQSKSNFRFPVPKSFVKYLSETDNGLTLFLSKKAAVRAMGDGQVEFADYINTKNYVVIIYHGAGRRVVYGYLNRLNVNAGDKVKSGQILGTAAYSDWFHAIPLLIEYHRNKKTVDLNRIFPFLKKYPYTAAK